MASQDIEQKLSMGRGCIQCRVVQGSKAKHPYR